MIPADYDALATLASAHMHRGVKANTLVTQADYGPALAAGALTVHETPAGLLLLRDRGDHTRLTFYLNDLTHPLGLDFPSPTVTEVAFRPRDTGLQEAAAYLQAQGFTPLLERYRLSRGLGETEGLALPPATPAAPDEAVDILAFLRANFSPLTGCLPTLDELRSDLAQGHVLVLKDGQDYLGLLHFSWDGRVGEIRHLAVAEAMRGRGLTRPLLAAYLSAVGGGKSIVWVRADYAAAQAAYRRFGFAPDGRRSLVLCYTKKEGT